MDYDEITGTAIDCALKIHKELGPGLLETVYEAILFHKLKEKGLQVERQVSIPIHYQGLEFEEGFRADIIVENKVILELKSVEAVNVLHKKQLLTYLKLSDLKLGLLLNFGQSLMRNGITRIANGLEQENNSSITL